MGWLRFLVGDTDFDETGRCSRGFEGDVGFKGRAANASDGEILEKRLPKVEKKRSKPSSDGLALVGGVSSSGMTSAEIVWPCLALVVRGEVDLSEDEYSRPPAVWVLTSGSEGTPRLCEGDGRPRAVARLLTIEEERSRVCGLRGAVGDVVRTATCFLGADERSLAAAAAAADGVFRAVGSSSFTVGCAGCAERTLIIRARAICCSSRSLRVRRAWMHVS